MKHKVHCAQSGASFAPAPGAPARRTGMALGLNFLSFVRAIARTGRALLVGALLAFGPAQSASADTIYTYVGNPFTTFTIHNTFAEPFSCLNGVGECEITGSFTLAQPLPPNIPISAPLSVAPTSWAFTDGVNVYTSLTIPDSARFFRFTTDASGLPLGWSVNAFSGSTSFLTQNILTGGCTFAPSAPCDRIDSIVSMAIVLSNPGTWSATNSSTTSVAEPPAILLLGMGLLGLVAMVLRQEANRVANGVTRSEWGQV